jgi:nucleotide-binding universal stress UspA family protein
MPAPILAAFDPYTEDRAPVELAVAAAAQTGVPVIAVAVYPWFVPDGRVEAQAGAIPRSLVERATDRVREDFDVETRIVTDLSVPRALTELAHDERASLLVVGSTSRGRVDRVLTGSTAERLLHGAPCPVALAPRNYTRAALRTIAVGFADTPEGQVALASAHALAARFGARLRVIAALHPSGGLDAAMARGMKPQRSVLLEGRHRAETRAALDRALRALPAGVDIEDELHVEDPADALLRVSEHVDLLVCGSRRYGPLRSVLLGGVSRRLVDEAQCPVLVLPRGVEHPLAGLLTRQGTVAAG